MGTRLFHSHGAQQEAAQAFDGDANVARTVSPVVSVLAPRFPDSGSRDARWLRTLGVRSSASRLPRDTFFDLCARGSFLWRSGAADRITRTDDGSRIGNHELYHAPDVDLFGRVLLVRELPPHGAAFHQGVAAHRGERCAARQHARGSIVRG